MTYSEYEDELRSLIEPLTDRHKIVMSMLCCERILPWYKAYSVAEKRGDYPFLLNSLNTLWETINNNDPLPVDQITLWLESFPEDDEDSSNSREDLIPDIEMEDSLFADLAFRAVCAFETMLKNCVSTSAENTVNMVGYVVDVAENYIGEVTGLFAVTEWVDMGEVSRWTAASPLVLEEKQIFRKMALILSQNPELGRTMIQELRALVRLNGIRPFLRNLVPDSILEDVKPTSPDLDFD